MGEEGLKRQRRCGFCDLTSSLSSNLMKCSGCLITYYCNRDHQVADWKKHKLLCKELQARRTTETCDGDISTAGQSRSIDQSAPSQSIDQSISSRLIDQSACSQFIDQSIPSRSIDQSIPSPSVSQSIQLQSINSSVRSESTDQSIRKQLGAIDQPIRKSMPIESIHQAIQRSIDKQLARSIRSESIDQLMQKPIGSKAIDQFVHPESIRSEINRSTRSESIAMDQSIQRSIDHSIQKSIDHSIQKSIDYSIQQSMQSKLSSSTISAIKRETNDIDDDGERTRRRATVIQSSETGPKSRSIRGNHRQSGGPPGPKRARRSAAASAAASATSSENCNSKSSSVASTSNAAAAQRSTRSRDDEYSTKKDHSLNCPLDLERDNRFRGVGGNNCRGNEGPSSRLAKMAQFVAAGLREYGWAIVDKFFGDRHCRGVLQEMQTLHDRGDFMEGRLLTSKRGGQLQGVRSDAILFLSNGSDDGIHVGLLVAVIDSLIFQVTGSVPPYNISGRTRPMLTCYPGQRSRYITHVDNPDKDGRCVTATYYLNEDWRPAHGGLLRLYPTSAFKPVDIEPVFDRLVLYWSDRRNPHEILPTYRKRFSINIWYYDSSEKSAADSRHLQCDDLSPTQLKSCC